MGEARALRAGDPAAVGPYTLTGLLGEGGQGSVYLAERDGAQVALKLLHTRFAEDGDARRRFVRELDAAKRVARFCTAQVLDADLDGDQPYIVSEYVPGVSLQELVTAEGPRAGGALERLAMSTLTALAAIHQAGLVHRDFKPQNVLMGPDGPRVIDFGIARALDATTQSQAVGTPAYMSPEQVNGLPLTGASDMFSWGASMLFAATGAAPFTAPEIGAILHRILNTHPDLSPLPEPLRSVVAASLAKDPSARPTPAQAHSTLLSSTSPDAPAPAFPPPPMTPPPAPAPAFHPGTQPPPAYAAAPASRGRGSVRTPLIAAASIVVALGVGVGVTGYFVARDGDTLSAAEQPALPPAPAPAPPQPTQAQTSPSKPPKPPRTNAGSPKPTKSQDAAAPSPKPSENTPTPASPPSGGQATNPYSPAGVCDSGGKGTGYTVQRKATFPGGVVYQLYSASTQLNCAVTMKTTAVGKKTTVWTTLTRQSDNKSATDRGPFAYYAGPVYLSAPSICVKISGGTPKASTTTPWSNCT
ncbi:serine/threonine-protein kinase [Actinocorallia sp. A-T 12471]|uniref:serine/threonine-protein kinase n=1 Tax=Actinocorallia sp. A-T 12471 TaxID=3089813 RepID=UPI0029CEA727|nr:serine/threonine-protein kinase [Actinocorallia sp. A-T 12471]MDX6743561.1 serine/threonine-protein kinase [Actinocorallia sp. A-T 12471]